MHYDVLVERDVKVTPRPPHGSLLVHTPRLACAREPP